MISALTRLIAIVAFAVLGGAIGTWVGDRSVPTRVIESTILTPTVAPGGELQIKISLIRDKLCDTKADRFVYDSTGKRYSLGVMEYPNGTGPLGFDDFISVTKMPVNMTDGPAKYVTLTCYQCNPVHILWPICTPPNTRLFEVKA